MPNLSALVAVADGSYLRREAEAHSADYQAQVAKRNSCQHRIPFTSLCGEAPDYCLKCENCGEPFCENHRTVIDGVAYCGPCARIGVAA